VWQQRYADERRDGWRVRERKREGGREEKRERD